MNHAAADYLSPHSTDPTTPSESVCPICYNTLLAILSEEETAIAMDSPAHPIEELGVTRLAADWQCGHIFCRREYVPLVFILQLLSNSKLAFRSGLGTAYVSSEPLHLIVLMTRPHSTTPALPVEPSSYNALSPRQTPTLQVCRPLRAKRRLSDKGQGRPSKLHL